MKIFYLNDETAPVTIRLLGRAPDYKNTYVTLQPQEGQTFEIDAPAGSIPFVKRWDNRTILLSYTQAPSSDQTSTSYKT